MNGANHLRIVLGFASALIVLVAVSIADAQNPKDNFLSGDQKTPDRKDVQIAKLQDQKKSQNAKLPSKPPQSLDAKTRNRLIKFVRQNHGELEPLLNSLKNKRPAQYQAALRSLNQSVNSLNAIKAKSSEQRYQQALEDWKLRSRIQLLSAQLSITDSPAKRAQLKKLIAKKIDNRIKQLNSQRDRAKQSYDRLTTTLSELESNRDNEIQKQLDTAIKTSERIRLSREKASKSKSGNAKAAKKKSDAAAGNNNNKPKSNNDPKNDQ